MGTFKKISWRKFLLHISFWLLYLTVTSFQPPFPRISWTQVLSEQMLFLPVLVFATYFTLNVLVQKYLRQGKLLLFAVLLVASAGVFVSINRALSYYILVPAHYPEYATRMHQAGLFYLPHLFSFVLSLYTVVAFAGVVTFVYEWVENEKARELLAREKLDAELKFLKSQIHPHFLFNMLNNLYSLSLQKSDRAPQMILRMSSMLDYMLYESNAILVPLQREVQVIRDYIELEKLRYSEAATISVLIGEFAEQQRIAPLILFPFIENSFKHGLSNNLGNPWITVRIQVEGDELQMKVENSKGSTPQTDAHAIANGIGLNNVRRRLDLLYTGHYSLSVFDQPNQYAVELTLDLHFQPNTL